MQVGQDQVTGDLNRCACVAGRASQNSGLAGQVGGFPGVERQGTAHVIEVGRADGGGSSALAGGVVLLNLALTEIAAQRAPTQAVVVNRWPRLQDGRPDHVAWPVDDVVPPSVAPHALGDRRL